MLQEATIKAAEKQEDFVFSFKTELWVAGKLVLISSSLQAGGRVHPGQVASLSQACLWTVGGSRSTW
ncbi:hypothetical protein CHARACLAT_028546 [Characodon lateralis]|uniref:Uncharacterized protein n=1 Tax=Characodon lateralis TaxID=208331 RepID=A0ABU7DKP2_9TELE|nr:hypothetical protein [Characodon lateralis]